MEKSGTKITGCDDTPGNDGQAKRPWWRPRRRRVTTHWDYTGHNVCRNCGHKTTGPYCSNCGQNTKTQRLRFRSSIRNFFGSVFNLEKGFLSTIGMLFTRPGYLSREYIDGKRTTRTNPFTLMFILASVYGITAAAMKAYLNIDNNGNGLSTPLNEVFGDGSYKYFIIFIARKLSDSIVFLSLAMLPAYTLSIKWLFARSNRRRYNYTELLYMGGYLASQRLIIDFCFLPYRFFTNETIDYELPTFGLYVIFTAYTFRQFFGTRWIRSIILTLVMFLMSMIMLGIAVALLAGLGMAIYYIITGNFRVTDLLKNTPAETAIPDSLQTILPDSTATTPATPNIN